MSGDGPTWRCSACDTYNAAVERVCEICGTAWSAAAPAARSGPKAAGSAAKRAPSKAVPKPKPGPRPKPKPTPETKAEPAAKFPLTAADEGRRGTPDIVALLPELFNEDGTLKAERVDALARLALPRTGGAGAWDDRDGPSAVAELLRKAEAGPKAPPVATRGEEVAGCSCLLVLLGAVVYGIVMLVMHWGAVTGWAGHVVGMGKASPSPTVTASGLCPPNLLATLPVADSAGARLAAVYRRPDVSEEYVLCRTTAGRLYFVQIDGSPPGTGTMGDPAPAKAIDGGYETGTTAASIVFRAGTMTYAEGGVKKWTARYEGEKSVG